MMPITEMQDELRTIEAVRRRRGAERVADFAARWLPPLEAELERATAGLGDELGGLQAAVDRAVGTRGAGGRRWRPLLVLAAAGACGADPAEAAGAAAAAELTHAASLALDDLPCMDDDATRRGLPSTHRLVGSAGAILVAVGLLGRSAELLAAAPRGAAGLCAEWGRCFGLRGMSGGQAADLAGLRRGAARRLLREKTTALSGFAPAAGARVAGADAEVRDSLAAFGRGVGWAYQLADDAEDARADAAAGRAAAGRAPLKQAARLLRLSEARLRRTPGLSSEGTELLASLARAVVPAAG
ncbi:MAG TPA: polyprenyl synthetase family protein [Longimicrobiaceae bacterium]|jgi:geranylgeranyl pyrophosphate synthase